MLKVPLSIYSEFEGSTQCFDAVIEVSVRGRHAL